MRWDKELTKAQAWGCPCHPNKYPRSTSVKAWGCHRGTPSSSAKIRSPFKTLYFYCFMYYAFSWSISCFCFQFSFVLFAAVNGLITSCFWRETCFVFHLPRTLRFSLLSFNEYSLFLELCLAFIFHFDFCSDLVISLYQGVFGPLVYVGFHQKSCFKKVQMVLKKRKNFMQKSGTKRSLFRLRLRLFYVVLDIVLIVCLVVLL
jgi:hypothetical protein